MTIPRRLAALLLVPTLASAQTVLATPASSTLLGVTATSGFEFAVGQTFRAPTIDTRLDQLSFWVRSETAGTFTAHVFAWDVALGRATGPSLFSSTPQELPTGNAPTRVDVGTGGVELGAGQPFVAFLSYGAEGNTARMVTWRVHATDVYADGRAVFRSSDLGDPTWTRLSWSTLGDTDLQFAFAFNSAPNVVPEPSTYALMATGLAGLAGVAHRRRRV